MNALKSLLLTYLHSGAKESNTEEENRRILVIYLFSLIGTVITGITAVLALINSNTQLACVLLIVSTIFTLGPVTQKITSNYRLSSGLVLYQLYILMFYLLYSGGANNTGPLWIFLTAPVTFFICGLRLGVFNLIIFTGISSLILLLPIDSLSTIQYPLDFKLRLISSFLTVSALTALYEYSRETSYKAMRDVSDRFEQLSKIDPLTQLSNRRDATNVIEYEQRRLVRNKTELSIIICDVDNFKKINDDYGHNVGDAVLVELAKIFKTCVRTQDTVARWGGEEFLFILPYTNSIQAGLTAQKIHKTIRNNVPLCKQQAFDTTVSMGISTIVGNSSIESAISAADKNLYKAKNSGKNRTYSDNEVILPD
ncbi:GGDEF domain-containing protein [Pseudocolwellia agarivorans]|uniref:GGDEF domain-containing protein n=1 Tax=Pseudocolwellia agarivorans TaxID=1911682 RepID=UPI001FEA575A|nr:GGDEF domain-containing protein [Pseudocolwellia agarivorans]